MTISAALRPLEVAVPRVVLGINRDSNNVSF